MTQRDRVLAALRLGPVSALDWLSRTRDGGPPILRVASRVDELRQRGYVITTRRASNGTAIYKLEAEAAPTPPATIDDQGAEVDSLFDVQPAAANSPYDEGFA